MGAEGLKARYEKSLETARYCEQRLQEIGVNAWRNTNSITVVMPKTPNSVKNKWQLATEGDISHVICMPNVSKTQIDEFIEDLTKADLNEERRVRFRFLVHR